ncbi:TPA: hypothetical protein SMW50_005792 [Pseudomonas aeruginosa]|nr:hypothetical protein [Pseudomonas aeruginosa]EIU2864559.1 hypothetical protein [Pseudomonas aeruginosa]HEK3716895.1 hypothetical protein [Pseudomonas aeruginosa]
MSKKLNHTGLHSYRLKDDGLSTLREKAFAELWQQEQESSLLEYLLGSDNQKGNVSERDAQVAATVVQWLGTTVGQSFMEKVQFRTAMQMGRSTDHP